MTWIKICGITNVEDALVAVDAGADALGFVFYEKSPRYVEPETAREIVARLPVEIEKIGVFVGNYPDTFVDLIRTAGLTATQLHFETHLNSPANTKAYGQGCFPPGFNRYLSLSAAFLTENEGAAQSFVLSVQQLTGALRSHLGRDRLDGEFPMVFLDAGTPQQPGGTGTAFDWQKAAPVVEYMRQTLRIVVAGGLTPANVAEAMRILKPWGVDVSSGVEDRPGKKDPDKIRAFIATVWQADTRQ